MRLFSQRRVLISPRVLKMLICLRSWGQTDLKVHFSHSRRAKSGGPRHTPECARGCWETWHQLTRSLLGLQWALLLWWQDGGPFQPDKILENDNAFSEDVQITCITILHYEFSKENVSEKLFFLKVNLLRWYHRVCSNHQAQEFAGKEVEGCCCRSHHHPPAPPYHWKSDCSEDLDPPHPGVACQLLALHLLETSHMIIVTRAIFTSSQTIF